MLCINKVILFVETIWKCMSLKMVPDRLEPILFLHRLNTFGDKLINDLMKKIFLTFRFLFFFFVFIFRFSLTRVTTDIVNCGLIYRKWHKAPKHVQKRHRQMKQCYNNENSAIPFNIERKWNLFWWVELDEMVWIKYLNQIEHFQDTEINHAGHYLHINLLNSNNMIIHYSNWRYRHYIHTYAVRYL